MFGIGTTPLCTDLLVKPDPPRALVAVSDHPAVHATSAAPTRDGASTKFRRLKDQQSSSRSTQPPSFIRQSPVYVSINIGDPSRDLLNQMRPSWPLLHHWPCASNSKALEQEGGRSYFVKAEASSLEGYQSWTPNVRPFGNDRFIFAFIDRQLVQRRLPTKPGIF
jgi:hypothetical protein